MSLSESHVDSLERDLRETREERDSLLARLEACKTDRAHHFKSALDAQAALKAAIVQRDDYRNQLDVAQAQRTAVYAERDSFSNALNNSIDQHAKDLGRLCSVRKERDAAIKSLSEVANDRDALRLENKSLHAAIHSSNEAAVHVHAERRAASALSDVALANNNRLKVEAVQLKDQIVALEKERDEALAAIAQWRFNYETLINDRDAALTEVVERDRDLNARCKELAEVREQLNIALTGRTNALRACDHVSAVNTTIAAERDVAIKERDELRVWRNNAVQNCASVVIERDLLLKENDLIRAEAISGTDIAIKARDAAVKDRDAAVKERDAAVAARDEDRQALDTYLRLSNVPPEVIGVLRKAHARALKHLEARYWHGLPVLGEAELRKTPNDLPEEHAYDSLWAKILVEAAMYDGGGQPPPSRPATCPS